MERFYTIQGEGFHSGRPAYFIRLGGCEVGCVWCDVKQSWDASAHPVRSIESLLQEALQYPSRFLVITGGEPAQYDLRPLCRLFHENGFEIAIETSGAYPLVAEADWICVSPKKFKAPLREVMQAADELKVVVYHKSDFSWAEENAVQVSPDCRLYLQPEYSRFDEQIAAIIDYVKAHPRWKISLQTHKIIDVP
ncbi:MAG: radical SAM protein [Bacteroidia bacterium]|nr:radical SAM protein [Bacteroidia bacterium]